MPFASTTFPERYEGMLVSFPQPLVISEYFNYARFGEIVLAQPLDGEDRPFTGTVGRRAGRRGERPDRGERRPADHARRQRLRPEPGRSCATRTASRSR